MAQGRSRVVWGSLEPEEDLSLSDLLWWKGEQLAVVEISLQVNGQDVARAAQQATTLRQAGAQAVAVVIGETWATPTVVIERWLDRLSEKSGQTFPRAF
jgi:hypothetical protein